MKYTPDEIKKLRQNLNHFEEPCQDLINELLDEIENLQWLIAEGISNLLNPDTKLSPENMKFVKERLLKLFEGN